MNRKPEGSWIVNPDGTWTPNLNDPAMKELDAMTPGGLKTEYREPGTAPTQAPAPQEGKKK